MSVNMIDLVLPVCAAKADALAEYTYVKGSRAFRRRIGNSSWVELRPNWHFPRNLPQAKAQMNIALGNTAVEKTARAIFGEKPLPLLNTQYHILDRETLAMRRYVIERGSWQDNPEGIKFPDRSFYHDELDGWLDEFLDTGWRLVEQSYDTSSDRAFLASIKPQTRGLHGQEQALLVQMMLGNRTAAQDLLHSPAAASAGPRDARPMAMLHTLAEAEPQVPLIPQ